MCQPGYQNVIGVIPGSAKFTCAPNNYTGVEPTWDNFLTCMSNAIDAGIPPTPYTSAPAPVQAPAPTPFTSSPAPTSATINAINVSAGLGVLTFNDPQTGTYIKDKLPVGTKFTVDGPYWVDAIRSQRFTDSQSRTFTVTNWTISNRKRNMTFTPAVEFGGPNIKFRLK
jgi:hypothetical protein